MFPTHVTTDGTNVTWRRETRLRPDLSLSPFFSESGESAGASLR